MPILPEEVTQRRFSRVYGQGYDRAEVEAFLAEVAADYGAAIEKMVRLSRGSKDVGEEINAIIRAANESMDVLRQKAEQEAEALQRVAAEKAATIDFEAHETQARAREQAYREAEQVTSEAEEYARELRDRTQRDCQLLIQEAEARRQQLQAYNAELHQHFQEIERLIGALRAEVELPELLSADHPADEAERPADPADGAERRPAGPRRIEKKTPAEEAQKQRV